MNTNTKHFLLLPFSFLIMLSACQDDEPSLPILETTDFEVTINENPENGLLLGMVDAETNKGELSYNLNSESIAGAFDLNESTGELTVKDGTKFDFEAGETVTAEVMVINGKAEDILDVTIHLTNVAEVIITSDFEATVDENPSAGSVIGTLDASIDAGTLQFELTSESVAGAFEVNPSTGELIVKNGNLFDFENGPLITAVVTATNGEISQTLDVQITLLDILESGEMLINDIKYDIGNFNLYSSSESNYGSAHYRRVYILTDGVFNGTYNGNMSNFPGATIYMEVQFYTPVESTPGEHIADITAWAPTLASDQFACYIDLTILSLPNNSIYTTVTANKQIQLNGGFGNGTTLSILMTEGSFSNGTTVQINFSGTVVDVTP